MNIKLLIILVLAVANTMGFLYPTKNPSKPSHATLPTHTKHSKKHSFQSLPEYDKMEFDKKYNGYGDEEIDIETAKKIGKAANVDKPTSHSERKCAKITYFSNSHYQCPKKRDEMYPSTADNCKEVNCGYMAEYGSTPCRKMVQLMIPFHWSGTECMSAGKVCHEFKEMSEKFPQTSEEKQCICQTIWCLKEIDTAYTVDGKCFKGTVTVKVPCKCDCRQKGTSGYTPWTDQ